jgi:hypothetical protein
MSSSLIWSTRNSLIAITAASGHVGGISIVDMVSLVVLLHLVIAAAGGHVGGISLVDMVSLVVLLHLLITEVRLLYSHIC